ncbi:hypothetical protein GPECTOR_2g1495 [Gonium pectorale]|uniref:Protein TIC 40, chloroplastic n=1 Tax=Gonium pectorale TaxID=33097 RepID=A0A150H1L8_GONPE|nr:hypothetical protein GPECTOR_2g1495 [Gonium pectorale]|eukprot:KXZ55944.1 hypothetical protein GPECTOR_2g1495 [Gonium pectorale]
MPAGDQLPVVSAPVEAPVAPPALPAAPLPETTAYAPLPPNAAYYQGMVPRQEYYMAVPPPGAYYPPPPAPYKEEAASTGAPWWIWLGAGVILGQILAKVQEFMKNPKTPQQVMAEMAMKQMMGAMGSTPGAGAGMPPFGGAGSPFGAAGPAGAANPFANFAAAAAAAAPVDTTAAPVSAPASPASTVGAAAASSSAANGERKGEKFASRLNSEGREARKPEPAAAKPLDIVEPVVKEPSPSGSPSSNGGGAKASSSASSAFFTDVSSDASSSGAGSSGASSSGAGASAQSGDTAVMSEMMESMLRNPEMQKMLYPYLPEPMRNPQSIEWMLSNPEVKKQMEQMFASQNVMSPQMMEMMKGMDFNQDKVNKQFAELGLKPEDVISKVMSNPELAAGFSNPRVQAAIMDISQNPMNIMKYQTDPEVMKVLEKVTEIFQPQVNQR